MGISRKKFKAIYGNLDFKGLAKAQEKEQKDEENKKRSQEAKKRAEEEGIGWDDVANLGKGLVAGLQQAGGRVADTALQASTVAGEVKRAVDPFKSSKQKDIERQKDVAVTEAMRKKLHEQKDITGKKISGTSKVDESARKVATGKASAEDIKDVGVMGLAVGSDATSLINPVAMATRTTGGRIVKDVASNALVGAIGGGSSAAVEDQDVLTGAGMGALTGGALAGAGHAVGGITRKVRGKNVVEDTTTPVETTTQNIDNIDLDTPAFQRKKEGQMIQKTDNIVDQTDLDTPSFMRKEAKTEFAGGKVKPLAEVDTEIDNLKKGVVPSELKVPHKEVTNISEVAFSNSLPDDVKASAILVMDEKGKIDESLSGLMDKTSYDAAHEQMDAAYNDRMSKIEQMPAPRQPIELEKLDSQYMKDLDDLEQKFEADSAQVAELTLRKEHLDAKEVELVNDVNMELRSNPEPYMVPDEKAVADRLAQLESERGSSQLAQNQSEQSGQLVGAVNEGVVPSKSKNEVTQQAIDDSIAAAENMVNTGKNPTIGGIFAGMPRRVLSSFGDAGKKIAEVLDNAVDTIAKNKHNVQQQVWKWVEDTGGIEEFNALAKALDGDQAAFSSLSDAQKKVFNQVRDMFNNYADRLGLPMDARVKDYLPHIFNGKSPEEIDAAIAQLTIGKSLSGEVLTAKETKALNDVLKGLDYEVLDMIKNNSLYTVKNNFLQKRTGAKGYSFNLADIILRYTDAAHNTEFLKPAYAVAKGLSENLNSAQNEYLAKVIHSIGGRPSDELGDMLNNTLESIWAKENKLYTNVSTKARKMIYDATMGANVGAALRNLSQGSNTFAKLGTKYYANGVKDAAQSFSKSSAGYSELMEEGVLHNRYSDLLRNGENKSLASHKFEEGLWAMFTRVEQFNRASAYFGAKQRYLDKYMSKTGTTLENIPEDVIAKAKKAGRDMSRQTQFEFTAMDNPIGLQSTTAKNIVQFQSYNISQVRFLKDMIVGLDDSMFVKGANGKYQLKPENAAQVARLVGANLLFISTLGAAIGMKPTDMLPYYSDIEKGEVPESPIVKLLIGSKTQPGLTTLLSDVKDADIEKLGTDTVDYAKSAAAMLVPGGSQAKKSIDATLTNRAGLSKNAEGNIQFMQDTDTLSQIGSTMFGKYSTRAGRDWITKGFPTLSEKQSEQVRLLDSEEAKKQYVEFYQNMKSVKGRTSTMQEAKDAFSTNPAKAERLVEEYNKQVDKAIQNYYKKYDSIPNELQEYLDNKVRISFSKIEES